MTITLSAELFGPFRLRRDGKELRPHARKTAGLIAFLVASDRNLVSRTRLASLLWSDRSEQQARDSLRQALSEIRAAGLDDFLKVSRTDVSIVRELIISDVGQIETMASDCDCASLATLLSRIDGVLLDDLDGLSPAFDDWLQPERVRQKDRLFVAAIKCVTGPSNCSTNERRALLDELARMDSLDETVVRMRLQIDNAAGDIAAIHRRYRRLSDDLARELSTSPSPETQELFRALIARPHLPPGPIATATALEQATDQNANAATRGPLITIAPFKADDGSGIDRFAAMLSDGIAGSLGHSTEMRVLLIDAIPHTQLPSVLQRSIASFALRGNIRSFGAAALLDVQLTNARTGQLLWSDRLDIGVISLDAAGLLIERIAAAVGSVTNRELANALVDQDTKTGGDALTLYTHSKRILREARTLDGVQTAISMLERVITNDPQHVGARLRLAQIYNTDFNYLTSGLDAGELRDRALQLVLEAAEYEPDAPRVQLLLAWCRLRRGDWDLAGRLLRRVEAQMPHDPDIMNECGFALAMIGEIDAARALLQRAFRLNPFPPAEYHADFAVLLALAGEHETAEEHFTLCGEQRLFWRVLRLCNLHRLDRAAPQLMALDTHFITSFRSIWLGKGMPQLDTLLAWGRTTFCFRLSEHQHLIAAGLTAAWVRQSRADVDSVS